MWTHEQHILDDPAGGRRSVSVVLPSSMPAEPVIVFCTDGQTTEPLYSRLAASGVPEWPILVGVHSDPATRAQEYLFNRNADYLNHEHFFVQTLRAWACQQFDLPVMRSTSVLSGFSNGGAFALTTALRHPGCFRAVFSFSTPKPPVRPRVERGSPLPAIYLAAGNLGPEKTIRRNVLNLSRWLRSRDVRTTVSERQAGHTFDFWASEFPFALRWLNEIAP